MKRFLHVSLLVLVTVIAASAQSTRKFLESQGWFHTTDCPLVERNPNSYREISLAQVPAFKACPACKSDDAYRAAREAARRAEAEAAAKRVEDERTRQGAEAARLESEAGVRPLAPLPETAIRSIARSAAQNANNDRAEFLQAFIQNVRRTAPEYAWLMFPVPTTDDGLAVTVTGPVWKYGTAVSEAVRKFLPTPESVAWDPTYSVLVVPTKINAPNIERVILQRDGKEIPQLRSTLKPSMKVTQMNAKAVINEGEIAYPAWAFATAPNLNLRLIAIPTAGGNVVHIFTNRELHSIR